MITENYIEKDYYGLIYKIKNTYNNKVYIGQTKRKYKSFSSYWGGGVLIKEKIEKYGKYFFKKEILGFCSSAKELDSAEVVCIKFFRSNDKIYGYNIEPGGRKSYYRQFGVRLQFRL